MWTPIFSNEVRIAVSLEGGDGIICQLFDDEGDPTTWPPHAVMAVGYYTDGPNIGRWFTAEVDDWEWSRGLCH